MDAIQNVIGLVQWGSDNYIYNLGKLPAGKATWKPEPTAKSALEITTHMVAAFNGICGTLQGLENPPEAPEPSTLEEAVHEFQTAVAKYIEMLEGFTDADLQGDVQMRFGPFPRARVFTMPLVDLLHHHGQLAYIQTLLGDEEAHFAMFSN